MKTTLTIMGKSEKHGYWLLEHMPFDYPEDQNHNSSSGMVYMDTVQQETWFEPNTQKVSQLGFIVSTTNPKKWYDFARKNSAEILEGVI